MERDMEAIFDKFMNEDNEYLKFKEIENKRSNRPDLHAFLLLDELFPSDGNSDMVCASEHDEFWLDIDPEDIEKLTDDQIRELVRCGVRCDYDCLCMFA